MWIGGNQESVEEAKEWKGDEDKFTLTFILTIFLNDVINI